MSRSPVLVVALLGVVACGSPSGAVDASSADGPTPDVAMVHVDDGVPQRQACTNNFGNALSITYGRLDGYLVAIVPPGGGPCNADSDHVHLQIRANAMIYDVAITVGSTAGVDDVHTTTRDLALPSGGPWAEGWHTTGVLADYVSLGLHSSALPLASRAQIASDVMSDLATANHVSIYATGYGPDGAHLVHRNGGGHDGLLVTEPLSTPAHVRMFCFTSQAF